MNFSGLLVGDKDFQLRRELHGLVVTFDCRERTRRMSKVIAGDVDATCMAILVDDEVDLRTTSNMKNIPIGAINECSPFDDDGIAR